MNRRTLVAAVLTAGLAAGVLTGCSNDPEPPEAAPTAPAETPAPEQTEPASPEPEETTPEGPEPEVGAEVGATVPADEVDAAREAGAHVYVSPHRDGSGLIVDPARPLPDLIRADIEAIVPAQMESMDDFNAMNDSRRDQSLALIDAGLSAFAVTPHAIIGADGGFQYEWNVTALGVIHLEMGGVSHPSNAPTRDDALALASEVFADWGWGTHEVIG